MKYKSDTYNPTSIQRKNLKKLADYLEALPKDYAHFGMQAFVRDTTEDEHIPLIDFNKETLHTCGTVACAIGHAPLLFRCGHLKSYWEISMDKFGMDDDGNEWNFCFGMDWAEADNTAQGAGKRINWFLENGLPEDWDYDEDTVVLYNPQEAI